MTEPLSGMYPDHRRKSALLLWLVQLAARMPRPMRLALLKLGAWIADRFKRDPDAPNPLAELLDLSPDESEIVRRLLLEGRRSQYMALLQGVFRHHYKAEMQGGTDLGIEVVSAPKSAARLVMLGSGTDARLLREAYAARGRDFKLVDLDQIRQSDFHLFDALEIASPVQDMENLIRQALRNRIDVSLHCPCTGELTDPGKLMQLSRQTGKALRLFHAPQYYEPALKVRQMLRRGAIGEITQIRIRATLAGKGGTLQPEPPTRENWLAHPAFCQFGLLAFFGGAIRSCTSYLNRMDPNGGQGLVSVKYEYPGRYGLLECTYAPQMHAASEYLPYDMEAEITGMDGFIRINRFMSRRTRQAPIEVRAGRSYYQIGIETDLNDDWGRAYELAAVHMSNIISGRSKPLLEPGDALSAIELKRRAWESSQSPEVVELRPG